MRVERILPLIFNDYYVRALSRSAFVGLYIHVPLILIGFIIIFSKLIKNKMINGVTATFSNKKNDLIQLTGIWNTPGCNKEIL